MEEVSIFWFRRDLRLYDNSGLSAATYSKTKVIPGGISLVPITISGDSLEWDKENMKIKHRDKILFFIKPFY